VRSVQRMPFTTVRGSRDRPPILPSFAGGTNSICSQARSVISPRLTMAIFPVVVAFQTRDTMDTTIVRHTLDYLGEVVHYRSLVYLLASAI
jgi:hypothetical protein